MNFQECYSSGRTILMEGALGERLKREYGLSFHELIVMAGLVYSDRGREALYRLWSEYIQIAKDYNMPFLATTPTRRANKERVLQSGYNEKIIRDNVDFLKSIRADFPEAEMYSGGLMGSRGNSYKGDRVLARREAKEFHSWQAELFQEAGADFLYAGIMPEMEEALGMADAMADTDLPYIISFMIGGDGCLLDGTRLADAIERIDGSVKSKPVCFMTNCIHPSIVQKALSWEFNRNSGVRERFRGIQSNTSALSPAELDGAAELAGAEPKELAKAFIKLQDRMDVRICGGCCGTDARHMEEFAKILSAT